ncbi:hypothetical protein R50912_26190 [Paenibacillus sp. FSL R5-0912]|nr:hypothetical protein R50912_26190 [Paenibacillus sp. FSL R5-0912]
MNSIHVFLERLCFSWEPGAGKNAAAGLEAGCPVCPGAGARAGDSTGCPEAADTGGSEDSLKSGASGAAGETAATEDSAPAEVPAGINLSAEHAANNKLKKNNEASFHSLVFRTSHLKFLSMQEVRDPCW